MVAEAKVPLEISCVDAKLGRCEEEEESEKNDDSGGRGRVAVKRDADDKDDSDEELPLVEPPLKESPTEALDGGATVEEVPPDCGLRERTLSRV